jgi:hypothetical protein
MEPLPSYIDVFWNNIATQAIAAMFDRSNHCSTHPHVGIKDAIISIGEREHQAFNEFDGKLTRMFSFLNVVVLYVRKNPHIARILSKGIA